MSNTGALVAANATITGGSISIKNASNVEVFKVSTTGKLTASDVKITGAIKASGTEYPDGEGGGGTVAMWSENGFRMSDGAAWFHGVGLNSYGEKTNTNITQVIQSKRGTRYGKLNVGATSLGAMTTIEAAGSNSGDGSAKVETSSVSNGIALIEAVKDSDNLARIELFGVTSDAVLTRKKNGSGSSENIITSPTIKHIIIISESDYNSLSSAEKNDSTKEYHIT